MTEGGYYDGLSYRGGVVLTNIGSERDETSEVVPHQVSHCLEGVVTENKDELVCERTSTMEDRELEVEGERCSVLKEAENELRGLGRQT